MIACILLLGDGQDARSAVRVDDGGNDVLPFFACLGDEEHPQFRARKRFKRVPDRARWWGGSVRGLREWSLRRARLGARGAGCEPRAEPRASGHGAGGSRSEPSSLGRSR